jgi:hypothetical protein
METMSSAFAIVLGVRSRSSRVRSWIWVAAPRRSTERDLANFATYVSCRVDWFHARRAGTSSAGSIGSKPGGLVHPLPGRLVPSPEGWYILCRGRRPRLQMQNKIREARRADTQDLLRHSWSFPRVLCQPSGLDECQSVWINLYCISGHVWPLQPRSLTRGRPPHPPAPYSPGQSPGCEGGAKRLDGADVRCEESSRIFFKIHYRAFASPTAPKNRLGRCTLTPIQSAAFKH